MIFMTATLPLQVHVQEFWFVVVCFDEGILCALIETGFDDGDGCVHKPKLQIAVMKEMLVHNRWGWWGWLCAQNKKLQFSLIKEFRVWCGLLGCTWEDDDTHKITRNCHWRQRQKYKPYHWLVMTMDCHAAACKQGKQVDCGELLHRHQKAMELITTPISFKSLWGKQGWSGDGGSVRVDSLPTKG